MWKIKLFCEVSHVWILGGTTWKSVAKLEGDWKGEKWKNSVVVSPKSPQQARGCPTCSRLYFCFSQAAQAQAQAPPSENHFSNIGQTPHSAGDGGERSRLVEAASEKWVPCRALPAVCRVPVREKHCSALIRGSGASNWNDQIELHPIGLHHLCNALLERCGKAEWWNWWCWKWEHWSLPGIGARIHTARDLPFDRSLFGKS